MMNVLVFSDIHGNLEALNAMLSEVKFDKAVFLGDIVDYGPDPGETLDIVFKEADYIVQGNHDYAAGTGEDCNCAPAMHDLSVLTRNEITTKMLGKNDLMKLAELNRKIEFEIDGKKFFTVHASPNDPLFGYMFSTEAEMAWKKQELKKYDYIMVGHTHFPMFYRSRIINPGSCGQPRDGNWKPMYAMLDTDSGELTFKRFSYDNEKMLSKLESRLPEYQNEFKRLRELYI